MNGITDQVASMLHANTNMDPTLLSDIASFDAHRAALAQVLVDRQTYLESVTPAQ